GGARAMRRGRAGGGGPAPELEAPRRAGEGWRSRPGLRSRRPRGTRILRPPRRRRRTGRPWGRHADASSGVVKDDAEGVAVARAQPAHAVAHGDAIAPPRSPYRTMPHREEDTVTPPQPHHPHARPPAPPPPRPHAIS